MRCRTPILNVLMGEILGKICKRVEWRTLDIRHLGISKGLVGDEQPQSGRFMSDFVCIIYSILVSLPGTYTDLCPNHCLDQAI